MTNDTVVEKILSNAKGSTCGLICIPDSIDLSKEWKFDDQLLYSKTTPLYGNQFVQLLFILPGYSSMSITNVIDLYKETEFKIERVFHDKNGNVIEPLVKTSEILHPKPIDLAKLSNTDDLSTFLGIECNEIYATTVSVDSIGAAKWLKIQATLKEALCSCCVDKLDDSSLIDHSLRCENASKRVLESSCEIMVQNPLEVCCNSWKLQNRTFVKISMKNVCQEEIGITSVNFHFASALANAGIKAKRIKIAPLSQVTTPINVAPESNYNAVYRIGDHFGVITESALSVPVSISWNTSARRLTAPFWTFFELEDQPLDVLGMHLNCDSHRIEIGKVFKLRISLANHSNESMDLEVIFPKLDVEENESVVDHNKGLAIPLQSKIKVGNVLQDSNAWCDAEFWATKKGIFPVGGLIVKDYIANKIYKMRGETYNVLIQSE